MRKGNTEQAEPGFAGALGQRLFKGRTDGRVLITVLERRPDVIWVQPGLLVCGPRRLTSEAELVTCTDGLTVCEVDFQQLLTLHGGARFLLEHPDNFTSGSFYDFTRGRICVLTIDTEGDPAWFVGQLNALDLFRRHNFGVEDVELSVERITQPKFLLIRREPNSVAGTAVTLGGTFVASLHFDAMQHFARDQIANLKAEQFVHVHKATRAGTIDGERSNDIAKGTNFGDHSMRSGFRDA